MFMTALIVIGTKLTASIMRMFTSPVSHVSLAFSLNWYIVYCESCVEILNPPKIRRDVDCSGWEGSTMTTLTVIGTKTTANMIIIRMSALFV